MLPTSNTRTVSSPLLCDHQSYISSPSSTSHRRTLLLTLLVCVLAVAHIPTYVTSLAPLVGAGGYARYFDHERADTLAFQWGAPPAGGVSFEYWVRIIDPFILEHLVVAFAEYNADVTPPVENPDALELRFSQAKATMIRGNADRYPCQITDNALCNLYSTDTWNHVAYVWNSTNGEYKLYRNGQRIFRAIAPPGQFFYDLHPRGVFLMTQEQDEFGGLVDERQVLDGVVDEFRIWQYARTDAEIAANWNRSMIATTHAPLNIYFTFDEADPVKVVDHSATGAYTSYAGELPSGKDLLTYSSFRSPTRPTYPRLVASRAPVIGSGLTVTQISNTANSTLTLDAIDDDTASLIFKVTSVPSYGLLVSVDTNQVLHVGDTITDVASSSQSVRIKYTPVSLNASGTDVFTYSADDGTTVVPGRYVVQTRKPSIPGNKTYTQDENSWSIIVTGGVSPDGERHLGVITRLPSNGQLYHAAFIAGAPTYESPDYNTSNLIPITQVGTIVQNVRGAVYYQSALYRASADATSVFDTFDYAWVDVDWTKGTIASWVSSPTTINTTGAIYSQSVSATVSVIVVPVNQAPEPLPPSGSAITDGSGSSQLNIALNSTDFDTSTYAPRPFARVTAWPAFGDLYQVQESGAVGSIINNVARVPSLVAYASAVLNFSSQFSRCPSDCNYPTGLCPGCTLTAFHATQALGPPDVYPLYSAGQLAWLPLTSLGNEFIELEFPDTMYPQLLSIYEVYAPGTVKSIRGATVYEGAATNWIPLWSGTPAAAAAVARIFEPSLCPQPFPMAAIRVDMDLANIGWAEYDAFKLTGYSDFPRGAVTNTQNRVMYVPHAGVHSPSSTVVDKFTYRVSDCQTETATDSVIGVSRLYSTSVDKTTLPLAKTFKLTSIQHAAWTAISLNASIAVITAQRLAALQASSLASSGTPLQITNIWLLPGTNLATGTTITQAQPTNATAFEQSDDVTSMLSGTGNIQLNSSAFGIYPSENQGTMKFILWVDYAYGTTKFTVRMGFEVNVTCEPGQYRTQSGVCQACGTGYYSVANDAISCAPCTDTLTTTLFYNQCVTAKSYSAGTTIFLIVLAVVGLVFVVLVTAEFWKNRMAPIIRASSVRFMMILLIGCGLGFVTVILIAIPPTNNICLSRVWVGHLAYALVFGPLFAKNWRVAQIFDSAQLRSVSITDVKLLKILGGLLSVVIAYMAAWTASDPPRAVSQRVDLDLWQVCNTNNEAWQYIILILEGIFSGIGVYIVIRARNTPLEFNETNHISIAIYNIVFVSVVVIPLAFSSVLVSPPSIIVLEGLAMWLSVAVVSGILTVPKLFVLFNIRIGANSSPASTGKPVDQGTPTLAGSPNGTIMSARASVMTPNGAKETPDSIREQIRMLSARLEQIMRNPTMPPSPKPGPWTPPPPDSGRRPASSAGARREGAVYQVEGGTTDLKVPDLRIDSSRVPADKSNNTNNRYSLSRGAYIHLPTSPAPPRSPYGHGHTATTPGNNGNSSPVGNSGTPTFATKNAAASQANNNSAVGGGNTSLNVRPPSATPPPAAHTSVSAAAISPVNGAAPLAAATAGANGVSTSSSGGVAAIPNGTMAPGGPVTTNPTIAAIQHGSPPVVQSFSDKHDTPVAASGSD